MDNQLPGQMALFSSPAAIEVTRVYSGGSSQPIVSYSAPPVTWQEAEPLCDVCGTACTSSKECVEIAGDDWENW